MIALAVSSMGIDGLHEKVTQASNGTPHVSPRSKLKTRAAFRPEPAVDASDVPTVPGHYDPPLARSQALAVQGDRKLTRGSGARGQLPIDQTTVR